MFYNTLDFSMLMLNWCLLNQTQAFETYIDLQKASLSFKSQAKGESSMYCIVYALQ